VEDFNLFGQEWLKCSDPERPECDQYVPTCPEGWPMQNGDIDFPEMNADFVTIDGDLSDWTAASAWQTFGAWYNAGLNPGDAATGLASTSRAQFAWDGAKEVTFVGIETDEGQDAIVEIGGLTLYVNTVSETDDTTTEIEFGYNGATVDIASNTGESIAYVVAAASWDGSTLTYELEIPANVDWTLGAPVRGNHHDEPPQYEYQYFVYVNVYNADKTAADSMTANGEYQLLTNKYASCVGAEFETVLPLP
jgi:hypothetical protein